MGPHSLHCSFNFPSFHIHTQPRAKHSLASQLSGHKAKKRKLATETSPSTSSAQAGGGHSETENNVRVSGELMEYTWSSLE